MRNKYESLSEFKKDLIASPQLQNEFKTDPVEAVNKIEQQSPLDTDVWIYRMVVFFLGATIMVIILGVVILLGKDEINNDKEVPTILTAIGSAAIGALAGLLAPSPKSSIK